MVKQSSTLDTLIQGLERYFLTRNSFRLEGASYDLVMLVESSISYDSYNLILSAKMLDTSVHYDVVREMLDSFRQISDFNAFSLINSLQVLRSDSGFVQKARRMFLARSTASQPIYEAHSFEIDGELFNSALFVRSFLLERLKPGAVVKLQVSDGDDQRAYPVTVRSLREDYTLLVAEEPSENWQLRLPACVQPEPAIAGATREYRIPLNNIQQVWLESDFGR